MVMSESESVGMRSSCERESSVETQSSSKMADLMQQVWSLSQCYLLFKSRNNQSLHQLFLVVSSYHWVYFGIGLQDLNSKNKTRGLLDGTKENNTMR